MTYRRSRSVHGVSQELSGWRWLAGVPGNPLARAVDRWQLRIQRGLVILWLLCIPIAAVAGWAAADEALHQGHSPGHRDRTQVTATVAIAAPPAAKAADGTAVSTISAVPATLLLRDGTVGTGTVYVPSGSPAGTQVAA